MQNPFNTSNHHILYGNRNSKLSSNPLIFYLFNENNAVNNDSLGFIKRAIYSYNLMFGSIVTLVFLTHYIRWLVTSLTQAVY